jgi:hypothetical protein
VKPHIAATRVTSFCRLAIETSSSTPFIVCDSGFSITVTAFLPRQGATDVQLLGVQIKAAIRHDATPPSSTGQALMPYLAPLADTLRADFMAIISPARAQEVAECLQPIDRSL